MELKNRDTVGYVDPKFTLVHAFKLLAAFKICLPQCYTMIVFILMLRSHIHGMSAGLAMDTIRHHSWQSVLVRRFLYCIRHHT